jgi:hypothetical protein
MDMKRLITGTLVGGIAMYAAGWLIWDMLFLDFYMANGGGAENLWRETPVLWAVAVGTLSLAALVTLALDKCEGASIAKGFTCGGVVGLLAWLGFDMIMFGYSNMQTLTIALLDPALEFVRTGIGGAAIAAVLAKTATTSSSEF